MAKKQKVNPGTLFIALSGKKQTGKNTSANILAEYIESIGPSVQLTAFAEPLKQMCIEILGLTRDSVYGTDAQKDAPTHLKWDLLPEDLRIKYAKEHQLAGDGVMDSLPRCGSMSGREALQVIGTDIFRALYGDVWAEAPFRKKWKAEVVILTDCRFPNEKLVTEKHGGVIIRLERDTGLVDLHASETALDGVHFENVINNNGTLQELAENLWKIVGKYGKQH